MWSNQAWAARHIKKHQVTPQEAWEAVYGDPSVIPIRAEDQIRFPPFRRLWTIGKTAAGRVLFVVWDQHRETRNLITAFEPDETRSAIYERQKKRIKK